MRPHRILALSAAFLVAGVLAGCTAGAGAPADLEIAPPVDLCAAAAPSGAASDAILVDGDVGSPAAVSFPAPLTITSTERTVVVEGDGAPVGGADLVDYAMTVFDAATGALLQQQGYDESAVLPAAAATVGQFRGLRDDRLTRRGGSAGDRPGWGDRLGDGHPGYTAVGRDRHRSESR